MKKRVPPCRLAPLMTTGNGVDGKYVLSMGENPHSVSDRLRMGCEVLQMGFYWRFFIAPVTYVD